MQIRLRTLTLHIDWLMLLFPVMALLLNCGRQTALLLMSLTLHEFAHWVAARALRVGMSSIRLTPFGGLSLLENPYSFSAAKLCVIAAAGPAANCLLLLGTTFLLQWTQIPDSLLIDLAAVNTLLMLFNLLPALPLDGGRILYGILSRFISPDSALRICLWAGRILAALLYLLAACGFARYGRLNLSILFAATFILASAADERKALNGSRVGNMLNASRPISAPTPADLIAIDAACPPLTALRAARPGRITLFAIYENDLLREITDDRTLMRKILSTSSAENPRL